MDDISYGSLTRLAAHEGADPALLAAGLRVGLRSKGTITLDELQLFLQDLCGRELTATEILAFAKISGACYVQFAELAMWLLSGTNGTSPFSPPRTPSTSATGSSAKVCSNYVEQHKLLQIIQEMMKETISEQPQDPYLYMSEYLGKFARASSPEPQFQPTGSPFRPRPEPQLQRTFPNHSKNEFPYALGPFGVLSTRWKQDLALTQDQDGQLIWQINVDSNVWCASVDHDLLRDCIVGWPISGQLGPLQSLLSLPMAQHINMRAPIEAVSFSWSYPPVLEFDPDSQDVVTEVGRSGEPDVNFILRGGWVFFNNHGDVCGVSTITRAPEGCGMQFGAPLPWKSEWTRALHGRFKRITTKALRDCGAQYFCWVRPGEPELQMLDRGQPGEPHLPQGGFAYLFHELGEELQTHNRFQDRVFPFVECLETPAHTPKDKNHHFDFVSDVWTQYTKHCQTPFQLLTSHLQEMHEKSHMSEESFSNLMQALDNLSMGDTTMTLLDSLTQDHDIMYTYQGKKVFTNKSRALKDLLDTIGIRTQQAQPRSSDSLRRKTLNQNPRNNLSFKTFAPGMFDGSLTELESLETEAFATPINDIKSLILMSFQKPYDLLEIFSIDYHILGVWLAAIEEQYNQKVPYHNWLHAWDVMQFTYVQLMKGQAADRYFDSIDVVALLSAAIAQDVAHPGVNNQYLCRSNADIAITYNDQSVLENMHASLYFKTLRKGGASLKSAHSTDFLQAVHLETYSQIREKVIHCILSTDMAHHFQLVGKLQAATSRMNDQLHNGEAIDLDPKLAMASVIHFATISNCTRPFDVYLRAATLLENEYFLQGDMEHYAGFPISPMMDREKDSIVAAQSGWISFVVGPLLVGVKELLPAIGPALEEKMHHNKLEMMRITRKGKETGAENTSKRREKRDDSMMFGGMATVGRTRMSVIPERTVEKNTRQSLIQNTPDVLEWQLEDAP